MDVDELLESPEITCVATGLKFTEGPLWHPDGYLLFTDVGGPWRIWKVVPGEEKTVYRDDTDRATGLTFDLHGNIIACEQMARAVTSMNAEGHVTAIATHCGDKRLNRPNDVVGRSDGSLYFSNRGVGSLEEGEADFGHNGVYRIAPDGVVHEEVYPFEDPNGLAISPDEKTYYQINTRPSAHIDAFDIAEDGSLSNQRRFFTFPESEKPGFPGWDEGRFARQGVRIGARRAVGVDGGGGGYRRCGVPGAGHQHGVGRRGQPDDVRGGDDLDIQHPVQHSGTGHSESCVVVLGRRRLAR